MMAALIIIASVGFAIWLWYELNGGFKPKKVGLVLLWAFIVLVLTNIVVFILSLTSIGGEGGIFLLIFVGIPLLVLLFSKR